MRSFAEKGLGNTGCTKEGAGGMGSVGLSYPDRIRRRIRLLWLTAAVMLLYMVIVGETGGDSRKMTELAGMSSRLIFFGGLVFIGSRIAHNKKLLKNRLLLQEQLREELDERNQYLHDKSGGIVVDVLLVLLLFLTMTAALYEMAAFHALLAVLLAAASLKAGVYAWYKYAGKGR